MATKDTGLGDILKDLAKKYDLRIGSLSDVAEPVTGLSTGNLALDYVTGIGGLPVGRSIELYGPPSSGKSTTALQAAAALQRKIIEEGRDEFILYLDHEHAMDADYAAALGLDVEHGSFLLAQPYSMEQGAESALKLIQTGKVRMAIWDSVAAMAPLSRFEGEFDQRTAAMNRARLMSGLLLQLTPTLHKHNCCGVFVNHMMESVEMTGRPGMPPKIDTPGGKGLKFYVSMRLEFRPIGQSKVRTDDPLTNEEINQAVGSLVRVRCVKNKLAKPDRAAEVRITYGQGFDNVWSAVQILMAYKAIRKDGAWYRFDGPLYRDWMTKGNGELKGSVQGESGVLEAARRHGDWGDQLVEHAAKLIDQHGADALDVSSTHDHAEVLGV